MSYQAHPQGTMSQQGSGDEQSFEAPEYRRGRSARDPVQTEGAFGMSGFASALPEYTLQDRQFGQPPQRFDHSTHLPMSAYQQQTPAHFAGQGALTSPEYNSNFSQQLPSNFTYAQTRPSNSRQYMPTQSTQQTHGGGLHPISPSYPATPFFQTPQQQQYLFYQPHFNHQSPPPNILHGGHRHPPGDPLIVAEQHPGGYARDTSVAYGYNYGMNRPIGRTGNLPAPLGSGSSRPRTDPRPGNIPSTPRGPPRKPKQSGHALWVGNLPPGTLIVDLKDHFSRDAKQDIESVFLISKSNCAFVNYRKESACSAAMTRFHDSRFQGARLVCRLRRNPASSASGIPTGPAALVPAPTQAQSAIDAIAQNRELSSLAEASRVESSPTKGKNKFFIVKSLTVEDLELSVRNGIWATQAHNESALNQAYESAEQVYLIFSANKSGEYYGYARMTSPINEDAAATLDWEPRSDVVPDASDLPRSIPTPSTEQAPKGRIIDDSARGTIFWEADPEDQGIMPGEDEVDVESVKSIEDIEQDLGSSGAQAFGKPFKVEWLSTNRLPFYRTRGLRNPWNANREVKIARDGTELETTVGERLVRMFHRNLPSSAGPALPLGPPTVDVSERSY